MAHKIYGQNVTIIKGESIDPLAGTWVFNDTIDLSTTFSYSVMFSTTVRDYEGMSTQTPGLMFTSTDFEPYMAYISGSWDDTVITDKTINITSKLSEVTNGDQLLAWLQVNAMKQ